VGLTERLRAELAELARAEKQLATSLESVNGGLLQANDVAGQLREDLETWKRDAAEATRLAAAFEKQLEQVAVARTGAERQVVKLGRELTTIIGRLTAEIDRLAPAPARR
jgi:chromosome segregation ATPase